MNNFSTSDIIQPINIFETQQIDENLCAICLDELGTVNTHTLENCNHTFCLNCIKDWREKGESAKSSVVYLVYLFNKIIISTSKYYFPI